MDGTAQTLVAAEMVLLGIYGNRGGKFTYFLRGLLLKEGSLLTKITYTYHFH